MKDEWIVQLVLMGGKYYQGQDWSNAYVRFMCPTGSRILLYVDETKTPSECSTLLRAAYGQAEGYKSATYHTTFDDAILYIQAHL